MFDRFLCSIGAHSWHYRLSEVGYVPLRGWPEGTTCSHCAKPYPSPLPKPQALEEAGDER
jgi:hypothetical protein